MKELFTAVLVSLLAVSSGFEKCKFNLPFFSSINQSRYTVSYPHVNTPPTLRSWDKSAVAQW